MNRLKGKFYDYLNGWRILIDVLISIHDKLKNTKEKFHFSVKGIYQKCKANIRSGAVYIIYIT